MSKLKLSDFEDTVFFLVPVTDLRENAEDEEKTEADVDGYYFFPDSGDIFPVSNDFDPDMTLEQLGELQLAATGKSGILDDFIKPFSGFLDRFSS